MSNVKKVLRQKAALERLQQQLVSNTKTVKLETTVMESKLVIKYGVQILEQVPVTTKSIVEVQLTEKDVTRINKEIKLLQERV